MLSPLCLPGPSLSSHTIFEWESYCITHALSRIIPCWASFSFSSKYGDSEICCRYWSGGHLQRKKFKKVSYELLMNIQKFSCDYIQSFSQTFYKLFANVLHTFCELNTNFLQTSYKLFTDFLQISYEYLVELHMNFFWTSYELLMNFLWTSYELLMNFLWTSHKRLMNLIRALYELLLNFLQAPENLLWISSRLFKILTSV
jgi:hypothetical protein